MNVETTRTHTITLNDRERDLLATLLNKTTKRNLSPKYEEDIFADELFDHLEIAGARILIK